MTVSSSTRQGCCILHPKPEDPPSTPIITSPSPANAFFGVALFLLGLAAVAVWGGTELKFNPEQCPKAKARGEICLLCAPALALLGLCATILGTTLFLAESAKGR